MPRIRRWFKVDHDINHSPTVRMLVRHHGAAGLRIWLEILSIADRCGDVVDISSPGALSRLASAAETRLKVVSSVYEALLKAGSIALHDRMKHLTRIVNYWEYHKIGEREKFPTRLDKTRLYKNKTPERKSSVVDNSKKHPREARVSLEKKKRTDRGTVSADPFRAIALEIMGRDVRRFQRLPAFIARAVEDRYSSEVISECLRRLLNAIERGQIDGDWWAYARAILAKAYEDDVREKHEALKRAEAEFLPRQGEIFAPHLDD